MIVLHGSPEYYARKKAEYLALCTFLESTEQQGRMDEKNVQADSGLEL